MQLWIYISILIVVIIVFVTGQTLKKMNYTKQDFKDAINSLKNKYDFKTLANVERIYRLETAHFKTSQFKQTGSPGMEKFANTFPFGWKTINKEVWQKIPNTSPTHFLPFKETATGKTKYFLVFPSMLAAVVTVAEFIKYYSKSYGDYAPARWYSTNLESIKKYYTALQNFKPTYTNELYT